ncbi:hypothetical protein T03_16324 [Trichinella britovi]|uniref:Uncharacterized protein n=2 Tax=Trichinella TaxID=6333 RepID=A0A0V1CFP7_TRIBR|nr:hypothetical protein T05_15187 [Trichinella murrelli]KRY47838.1 hypothetical protein T03_16324 [Trichinella britovi]
MINASRRSATPHSFNWREQVSNTGVKFAFRLFTSQYLKSLIDENRELRALGTLEKFTMDICARFRLLARALALKQRRISSSSFARHNCQHASGRIDATQALYDQQEERVVGLVDFLSDPSPMRSIIANSVVGRRICAILAVAEQDPISKASIKNSTLFPFYTVFSRVNRPDGRGCQFIGVINPAPVWAANCWPTSVNNNDKKQIISFLSKTLFRLNMSITAKIETTLAGGAQLIPWANGADDQIFAKSSTKLGTDNSARRSAVLQRKSKRKNRPLVIVLIGTGKSPDFRPAVHAIRQLYKPTWKISFKKDHSMMIVERQTSFDMDIASFKRCLNCER